MKTNFDQILMLLFIALSTITLSCKKDGDSIPTEPNHTIVSTGALNGLFSVSASKQIHFSQGNLQYQASTDTWKFADNQWDYIGNDNINISYNYTGWIDLFGWGTGNNPTNNSESHGDYGSFDDWGNNSISNINDNIKRWYTLTAMEWEYLIEKRNTPSGLRFVRAIVNDVKGLIILPDDWNTNTYNLNSGIEYSSNQISLSEWDVLESAGAVFLPAAGSRNPADHTLSYVGTKGYYWSSSFVNLNQAWCLEFTPYEYIEYRYYRRNGMCVRLVCNK